MLSFGGENEASHGWLHAQHAEIISRDVTNGNTTCAGTGAQSSKIYVETGHLLEGVRLRAIIEQIRIGKSPQETAVLKLLSHDNKAGRVSYRKWTQSERIHNAKNRGVSADAERKSQHGYKSEFRILAEGSEGVAQILQERVDVVYAACFAAFSFGTVDSAEFQTRTPHRFLASYAVADEVLGVAFDMETQLRIHFVFHARAPERGVQPGPQLIPDSHICSGLVCSIAAITSAMRFHFSASVCKRRLP